MFRTRARARVRHPFLVAATALTVGAATALTLGTTGAATAAESAAGAPAATGAHAARHTVDEPLLKGSAKLKRQPGDNVHFTFDAHGLGDKARGTFYVSHHIGKQWGGYFKGRIDCLLTGGPVAVATGIVEESHFQGAPGMPDVGDLKGKRFGFTVLDNGRKDRLGYSWALDGLPEKSVGKCLGSAPIETLAKGNYTVHHWMPPRTPAKH
ncbi:hypothetical protein [Streptomyces chattanoogensis]|uniref:Repetin n=1 Tax=Streptomyces chattanoogensis TaxID=66876 RepID=A0A0N0XUK3_9ACTN|nr:hypothetical protein [Streptomyces chattanoogensis]KPC60855.1 hypothetical protein ADL29_27230 [Streptomyces chattanoogensis]